MRVERLLRKMEERSKRRQKRKEEVRRTFPFDLNRKKIFCLIVFFSGHYFIKRKNPKDTMIQPKSGIFDMHEKIWEIIFLKQHRITLYQLNKD
jgi:hypothetical protein